MSETAPQHLPDFVQRFASTRDSDVDVALAEAVLRGLADDGGLFVPRHVVPFSPPEIDELLRRDFAAIAATVMSRLLGREIETAALERFFAQELGFELPLTLLEPRVYCLELFWGPTLAFKDIGARFMAFLLRWAHQQQQSRRHEQHTVTVLAATSGDTGSAVAHAFWKLPDFRVVVLFPEGQVSEAQRRLFTALGENTAAVAVRGTFDDCQRLVKQAFRDDELRALVPLASANSINVARWLPQAVYYFTAVAELRRRGGARARPLLVSVPCGNFGNLTAGLLAKRLGLPVDRFVAATNRNDVVPAFLRGGDFRPRPSVSTPSNAMDVGDPSNFERLMWLYGGDVGDRGDLESMRRDVEPFVAGDDETLQAIRDVRSRTGRLLDPHTAVAYLGARHALAASGGETIVVATAHPAKFEQTITQATGQPVELPATITTAFERKERITPINADYSELRSLLSAV